MRRIHWLVICINAFGCVPDAGLEPSPQAASSTRTGPPESTVDYALRTERENLLSHVRQLTFVGRRSGESYFSSDGAWMVFQAEREPENPFFQIHLMDLRNGDVQRISPGIGKTTCAWIHPSQQRVLFASTHEDPDAQEKQKTELELRASGKERRYSWDFDSNFDIYEWTWKTGALTNLTNAPGYDAEGSYSPDGDRIVFSSNRHAYANPLPKSKATKFQKDPSYLMDLYIMAADGTDVRRLTNTLGYDGGPFFSPNGLRICWRSFDEDGATAEVFTMNTDGADVKQITRLGSMSWAPFYHPSGDYLIFTTNRHGFSNFELYLVGAEGVRDPVRVTFTDGFDGLPVFAPDGHHLCWTGKRTPEGQSQLFFAEWNDAAARLLLGIEKTWQTNTSIEPRTLPELADTINEEQLRTHVTRLASEEMEGRQTGTKGEELATQYVADRLVEYGLAPDGDHGTYFQPFEFTAGISLGIGNELNWRGPDGNLVSYQCDVDWRPLAFSATDRFALAPVVFAGYGIVAPEDYGGYDSYVHLDVKDKWVLVLRYLPEDISASQRQKLSRFASLRYKAMVARDRGAKGLIVVSGPNAKVKKQLVPLSFDASLAGTSIAILSVTDTVAQRWLAAAGHDLAKLHSQFDSAEPEMGLNLMSSLEATIDLKQERRTGRNVIARLRANEQSDTMILVGAHIDHLGRGLGGGSLASGDDEAGIHYGADDNASGVAAILEIARFLAEQQIDGRLEAKHDIVFAFWSGEELGLLGSGHYAGHFLDHNDNAGKLHPTISSYVNLDMVGRYEKGLTLNGVGSSTVWPALIERSNVPIGLRIVAQQDSYVPTDATTFYAQGVPILSGFTGAHSDYHTPGDTSDKINYADTKRITEFFTRIVRGLATRSKIPDSRPPQRSKPDRPRSGLRAYLGTIPDYSQADVKGVKLSGVGRGGPAEKVGVRGGDTVIELAGRKIENIYDYTYAIDAVKIGEPVEIVVQRDDKRITMTITPESRE